MTNPLDGLMKQAQEMQSNMQKAQEELANIIVEGKAGGGMVTISMSCRHEIKNVSIDDSLMSDDKDMLEDLLTAAMNDAVKKVEEKSQTEMSGLTSGMNLPPGFKLPF